MEPGTERRVLQKSEDKQPHPSLLNISPLGIYPLSPLSTTNLIHSSRWELGLAYPLPCPT